MIIIQGKEKEWPTSRPHGKDGDGQDNEDSCQVAVIGSSPCLDLKATSSQRNDGKSQKESLETECWNFGVGWGSTTAVLQMGKSI